MFDIPVNIIQSGISPSRTYMIGVYDPVSPNEIRFEKVTLPEAIPNSIKDAKMYYLYLLGNVEKVTTTRIMVSISLEEYLNATHSEFAQSDKEDIESTLSLLYDWNSKQQRPSESYNGALTTLLKHVALMDDFDNRLTKLKKMALALLQIE